MDIFKADPFHEVTVPGVGNNRGHKWRFSLRVPSIRDLLRDGSPLMGLVNPSQGLGHDEFEAQIAAEMIKGREAEFIGAVESMVCACVARCFDEDASEWKPLTVVEDVAQEHPPQRRIALQTLAGIIGHEGVWAIGQEAIRLATGGKEGADMLGKSQPTTAS